MVEESTSKSVVESIAQITLIEERERVLDEKIIVGCVTKWVRGKYCEMCADYNKGTNSRDGSCELKRSSTYEPIIDNKRGLDLITNGIVDSESEYFTLDD